MGASQQSVGWKLAHEYEYLKKIKEENKKNNPKVWDSKPN